jgi:hypothetical protein
MPNYFRHDTIWTGATLGTRTFTVYGGSANFSFELALPSGEEWRLRVIRLLSDADARMLLHHNHSFPSLHPHLLAVIQSSRESSAWTHWVEQQLMQASGRLPRDFASVVLDLNKSIDAIINLTLGRCRGAVMDVATNLEGVWKHRIV